MIYNMLKSEGIVKILTYIIILLIYQKLLLENV